MIDSFENPEKILVIRLSSIGDILLATPLLRAVRKRFPSADIDFIVKDKFQEILWGNPHITHILPFEDELGFSELRRIKKLIVEKKYDWLIDIHKNLRSLYLRTGAGTSKTFRYSKQIVQRFLLIQFKWNIYHNITPIYRRYMAELGSVGINDDDMGLEVYVDSDADERVLSRWGDFFKAHPLIIGMVPGAGYATKRWLPEGFAKVGERLMKNNSAGIILFGGPQDKALHNEILSQMTGNSLSLAGKTSLQESIAAMSHCSCVVTNDTGLMHVAAALKKKVVAIFGATTEELGFFPNAKEKMILQYNGLSCRPCTHVGSHRCPKKHFNCMRKISTKEVYSAVIELMHNSEQMSLTNSVI